GDAVDRVARGVDDLAGDFPGLYRLDHDVETVRSWPNLDGAARLARSHPARRLRRHLVGAGTEPLRAVLASGVGGDHLDAFELLQVESEGGAVRRRDRHQGFDGIAGGVAD